MTEDIKNKLLMCADVYHCAEFIVSDPVQFPHRYKVKQDIEISGLLTAIMSFGNRKQILKKANELHDLMGESPYQYVMSRQWEKDFPVEMTHSFYRMLSYADFHGYFQRLYKAYSKHKSLEDTLNTFSGIPMERLCAFLEVSPKSPQKKLNMFLRWMIRQDSEVDLGIWKSFDRRDLIVPLDTHVCRVAHFFNLTDADTFSLKNARHITAALAEVFPNDPCLGDFALFGLGVNGEI
ncbi:TIGR02757 family protein [Bacteroides sp.]|uniref:TIGR02757 family protein n=1 Tax=Bacteroides sp. TaxID=29523 RepID=UPI0026294A6D|nr:TIGR02757 family protein [Bacteroides sp.]MDD3038741.1 TIGR02757 family protein [Bacteroides sp.]